MNKKIGIIDCNNFYVSCERVFNPISIGKPTIVLSNNDGCVIARSQEAKDLGIKMGEPYFLRKDFLEQNSFCVYSSNYNLYGDMSDRVMTAIKKYANEVEVYSIDECFVDFSNIPDEELDDRLHLIRNEVKRLTGIPVSIGVGPNKTLAKLTSYMAKKQQSYKGICSYWSLDNLKNSLYTVAIDEVWGIGRRWAKRLEKINVTTVGQFIEQSDTIVRSLMNVNGLKAKMELSGGYCYHVRKIPKAKRSVASTRSFGQDIDSFDQVAEAMYSYIERGIKKLTDNEVSPNKATIFVCGNRHKGDGHYASREINLHKQTRDKEVIWSQVYPHLRSIYNDKKKYKKCGIVFSSLRPDSIEQGTLFSPSVEVIPAPFNKKQDWKMRQEHRSQKFTTSWKDIPIVTL